MRLLYGADAVVAQWVAERIPQMESGEDFGPCVAIGVVAEDSTPLGGVVFNNWQPKFRSIEVSFAASSARWLTRPLISEILTYPFAGLDCRRITAVTPRKAASARRFLEVFGFKREGLVREGFGDDDAVVSGLLWREWRCHRYNVARDPALPAAPRPVSQLPRARSRRSALNGQAHAHSADAA